MQNVQARRKKMNILMSAGEEEGGKLKKKFFFGAICMLHVENCCTFNRDSSY